VSAVKKIILIRDLSKSLTQQLDELDNPHDRIPDGVDCGEFVAYLEEKYALLGKRPQDLV
jgi:hypothetical protein